MKHILILSDTHGLLREEVKALLDRADVVIHAGDLNTPAIVEALRAAGETLSGAITTRTGRQTCPTA